MMIGDSLTADITGGKNAGMKTKMCIRDRYVAVTCRASGSEPKFRFAVCVK